MGAVIAPVLPLAAAYGGGMENAMRLTREQTSASSAMLGSGLGMTAGAITSGAIDRAVDSHKAKKSLNKAEKEAGVDKKSQRKAEREKKKADKEQKKKENTKVDSNNNGGSSTGGGSNSATSTPTGNNHAFSEAMRSITYTSNKSTNNTNSQKGETITYDKLRTPLDQVTEMLQINDSIDLLNTLP